MNRKISAAMVLAVAVILSSTAPAQAAPIGLGPRIGVELDDSNFSIGGEARFAVLTISELVRLDIRPTIEYFFIDTEGSDVDVTALLFGGDAIFAFNVKNPIIEPYAFAGLAISYIKVEDFDSETDVGVNLGGGAKFLPNGRIQPFAELRITISDENITWIGGGVLFVL